MQNHTFFLQDTGMVIGHGHASDTTVTPQPLPEQAVIDGFWSGKEYYFVQEEFPGLGRVWLPEIRPEQNTVVNKTEVIADGMDSIVFSNLPPDVLISIEEHMYEVEGDSAEITFDTPKTYKIRLEAFPYLPAEFEVTAL